MPTPSLSDTLGNTTSEQTESQLKDVPRDVIRTLEAAMYELRRNRQTVRDQSVKIGVLTDLITGIVQGNNRPMCGESGGPDTETRIEKLLAAIDASHVRAAANQPPVDNAHVAAGSEQFEQPPY